MFVLGKSALEPEQLEYKEKNGIYSIELFLKPSDLKDLKILELTKSYDLSVVLVHAPHVGVNHFIDHLHYYCTKLGKIADYFNTSIILHENYSKTEEGLPIGRVKPEIDLLNQANKLEFGFGGEWEWGLITENTHTPIEEIWNLGLRLSLCLDLEHMYRVSHIQPTEILEVFAKRWRKKLSYLKSKSNCNFCTDLYKYPLNVLFHHLHISNHLNSVGHLPLKIGEIDYKKVFDTLKKYNFGKIGNETITIETPLDDVESFEFAKGFFE